MSVDLLPVLIDELTLATEIQRLRGVLSPDELNCVLRDFPDGLPRASYTILDLQPSRDGWCYDAQSIRFQLLTQAWKADEYSKALRAADALFEFLGAFICCWGTNNPLNEYGFASSAIISAGNARRLHLLFRQIDFALLRPIFADYCTAEADGTAYRYITSFAALVEYAKALKSLLVQAEAADKTLYIHVSY